MGDEDDPIIGSRGTAGRGTESRGTGTASGKTANNANTLAARAGPTIREPDPASLVGMGPVKVEMDPKQILLPPFKGAGNRLDATKVEQGALKNCCVPAVLSAMANTNVGNQRIHQMISIDAQKVIRSENRKGTMFTTSGPVTVSFAQNARVVISRLLYLDVSASETTIFYAYYGSGEEGWVSFIEKAYAIYVSSKKNKPPGYANIAYMDPNTVMNDLMAPGKPAMVTSVKEGGSRLLWVLKQATDVPTVAATPSFPDGRFNVRPDSSIIANHAYAVRKMAKVLINKTPRMCVILSSPDDYIAYDDFLRDFDVVSSAR